LAADLYKSVRPSLWIIAGANGSGKTSSFEQTRLDAPRGTIWIINPDALARRIFETEIGQADEANLEAVKRIENWLYASVDAHQSIGVETVLSTTKYQALVEAAQAKGYEVALFYVYLETEDLNVSRVAKRVKAGGHDVPEQKIRDRRKRSLENFSWFFDRADRAYIFDNSRSAPALVCKKENLEIDIYGELLPILSNAIQSLLNDEH
jgi:predicted ABC-type ATPase